MSKSKELYPDAEDPHKLEQGDCHTAFGDRSPGVRRIEAITTCFTRWHLVVLFITILFISYAYGLDGTLRGFFQNFALNDFGQSAQISSVTVVRSIVAAAAQPAYAKISDYFGRMSILLLAIIFYVVGTILNAAAGGIDVFLGGSVLYQFGYTGVQLLVEVLIGDTTSLRNRLFFSYIPATPFLINAWVSGNIQNSIQQVTTWRWGIGMWCIIFPVTCIPLFLSLISAEVRAKRAGLLKGVPSPFRSLGRADLWLDVFWQIDLIGLVLLAGMFITILLPFTLAGGAGTLWGTAKVIAPLVVGFVVLLPAFVVWELKFAKHPAVPFRLMRDRQILAGLSIACLLNTAWYTQGDYLYYTLFVSFNQNTIQTARIQNIYSFVSVVVGLALGLVVRKVRYLKWFVVAGTALFILAFGLLYRYRSSEHGGIVGLIAAETILGIAGGLFPYPTQALVQSAVQHERLAVITSLYLACYSIGSALGNTIAAGIWTNHMPGEISKQFAAFGVSSAELEALAYASPLTFIETYTPGTTERRALTFAYAHVQRLLTIAGLAISVLIFFVSLCLRNPYLGDTQSLEGAEGIHTQLNTVSKGGHGEGHGSAPESPVSDDAPMTADDGVRR